MQNYSSRFKVKNYAKDDVDNSINVLPTAVLIFLLFGKSDENITKLAKKVIIRNGSVQGNNITIEVLKIFRIDYKNAADRCIQQASLYAE